MEKATLISDDFNFWFTLEYLMLGLQCSEPVVNALFCSLTRVERCWLAAQICFDDLVMPLVSTYNEQLAHHIGDLTKQKYPVSCEKWGRSHQLSFVLAFRDREHLLPDKELSIRPTFKPIDKAYIRLDYLRSTSQGWHTTVSQTEWLDALTCTFRIYLLLNSIDNIVLSLSGWRWTDCEGGFYINDLLQQELYTSLWQPDQVLYDFYTQCCTTTVQIWPTLKIGEQQFGSSDMDEFLAAFKALITSYQ